MRACKQALIAFPGRRLAASAYKLTVTSARSALPLNFYADGAGG
jgi:hypothetical protein